MANLDRAVTRTRKGKPAAIPSPGMSGDASDPIAAAPAAPGGEADGLHGVVASIARGFDVVERWWEAPAVTRRVGSVLVAVFLGTLAATGAARAGWLPPALAVHLPSTHFGAVNVAFGLLLLLEVAGLIVALAKSVADSVGKQFELLALILMREAFLAFTEHGNALDWSRVVAVVPDVLAEMAGALAVFVLLVPYYRVQRHRAITEDRRERASFIAAKKVVASALLLTFVVLGAQSLLGLADGGVRAFFSRFYTVLVLSDVLIVLLSLRYTSVFRMVFRNAGFAAATAMARLALGAPPYMNAVLATTAMLFALALSLAHNAWADAERRSAVATPP